MKPSGINILQNNLPLHKSYHTVQLSLLTLVSLLLTFQLIYSKKQAVREKEKLVSFSLGFVDGLVSKVNILKNNVIGNNDLKSIVYL